MKSGRGLLRHCPGIRLERLRKSLKNSIGIARNTADIQTRFSIVQVFDVTSDARGSILGKSVMIFHFNP
jgi:hypothetical protein